MTGPPGPIVPIVPDAGAVALAVSALESGRVVAVPTDTVYGLAVDPTNPEAVEQLFSLKQRPADVALPVLVGRSEHVSQVAGTLDSAARHLADRYWPGPLTLVVPRRRGFTADLGGPGSVQADGRRALAGPRHRTEALSVPRPVGRDQCQPPWIPAGHLGPAGGRHLRRVGRVGRRPRRRTV